MNELLTLIPPTGWTRSDDGWERPDDDRDGITWEITPCDDGGYFLTGWHVTYSWDCGTNADVIAEEWFPTLQHAITAGDDCAAPPF